ncbi:MAG: PAS domain-containing protein [Salinivirgaceae bacterium]|nr:PAS domain-containing protein [Salinivirgaceae bacterium]
MRKLVPGFLRKHLGIRVLLSIIFLVSLMLVSVLGIMLSNSNKQAIKGAQHLIDANTSELAEIVIGKFCQYNGLAKSLNQGFGELNFIQEKDRRPHLMQILKGAFNLDLDFETIWSVLEPNAIDNLDSLYINKPGSTIIGNFNPTFHKQNNKIILDKEVEQDPVKVYSRITYKAVKESNLPVVSEPFYSKQSDRKKSTVLTISMVYPILHKGIFKGVIGFEVPLTGFSAYVDKTDAHFGSYSIIVSNKGEVVSHPELNKIGKKIDKIELPGNDQFHFTTYIEKGIPYSFTTPDNMFYVSLAPVAVESIKPWAVMTVSPLQYFEHQKLKNTLFAIIIALVGLLVLSLAVYFILRAITNPLRRISNVLTALAIGNFDESNKLNVKSEDELADVGNAINLLIDGMVHTSKFAIEIGEGNLDSNYTPHSDQDTLGQALVNMRLNIKEAREKELEQREVERTKQWSANGINGLGSILRFHNQNIEELSYASLKYLIDYLGAAQGATYIKNDDNPEDVYFELAGALAFGRERLMEKKILPEEGLVGRCAEEGLSIYLTEIPHNYPEIKSGLGGSTPNVILLVPMKINEEVLGVVELISFKTMKNFEIEFVEKIGQDMASTIANVRTNQKTARLLKQSQKQSEELATKEEEMRQTIEEMNATQEEAESRFQQISTLVEAVNQIAMVAEFDPQGHITEINENFLRLLGVNRQQMMGRKQGSFGKETNQTENDAMWRKLRQGQTIVKTQRVDTGYKTVLLSESYVPIKDAQGKVIKVFNLATDITHTQ